jgi:hypothetical protein
MAHRFEIKYSPHRNQDLVCPQQENQQVLVSQPQIQIFTFVISRERMDCSRDKTN